MRSVLTLLAVCCAIVLRAQPTQKNKDSLLALLQAQNIPFAKEFVVLAVAESGLAHPSNNLFGMYHPKYRKTTSVSQIGKYAVFKTWQDAVIDLTYWIQVSPPKQNELFTDFIRRRAYNPNPAYYTKLQYLIRKEYNHE